MNNKDMINELRNIKDKMKSFGYTINSLIKELDKRERLNKFKESTDKIGENKNGN